MRPAAAPLAIRPAGQDGQTAQDAEVDSRSSSSATSPVVIDNEESDFASNDSDSSLGPPKMRPAQDADGSYVCDAPIHALPNEILINIFAKLEKPHEVLQCILTCKRWAKNAVDLLWHRPACTTWPRLETISHALTKMDPYFAYNMFIKRLNLAALAEEINDGSVKALSSCNRVERLTLTNCTQLTDGGVTPLVQNSHHLLALDVSGNTNISDATILAIAENCKRLQGLNISSCGEVTDASMVELARACRYIKRVCVLLFPVYYY
jgi:F-box and leucine-rich repeat protein GRR1